MKVLIDFTQIPIKKAGVGVYAMSLLKSISHIKNDLVFYIIFLNDDIEILNLLESNPLKFKTISVYKVFRKLPLRFLVEQVFLPFIVYKNKISVIHSLHYSFPFFPLKAKKVVTLHDMTYFLYPEYHKKVHTFFFKTVIKYSIFQCDKIICVSESTKRDVIRILKVNQFYKKKLIVIPLGTNITSISNEKNILYKFDLLPKNYFLFIGTIEPRKNLGALIEAYAIFCQKSTVTMDLVIIGKKGWHYEDIFKKVEILKLEKKIKFTGFVNEMEKLSLLSSSYAFVYPSVYEGFGIPVLEAMACGIPCITSNVSSIPEVVGDAGILIDPNNISGIYESMLKLVFNKNYYSSLCFQSLERAKLFSWEKMTLDTLDIYSEN